MRDALQTASINPETGTIDMSILNTGRSETARVKLQQIADAVRDYVSSSSANRIKLKDLLEALNAHVSGSMVCLLRVAMCV